MARLSQTSPFIYTFRSLISIRWMVDYIADAFRNDLDAQCNKAQALLKHYRRQNTMPELRAARRIIEGVLYPGWGLRADLQTRFTHVADFFEQYTDYFLSYTNKEADVVNQSFRKAFFDENRSLFRKYGQTVNLLARQTVQHFTGLSGFYDKQEIIGGDEIRPELVRGAQSAIVLVQILAKALLEPKYAKSENYCFQEYEAYKLGDSKSPDFVRRRRRKYRFLLAEQPEPTARKPAEAVKPSAACAPVWPVVSAHARSRGRCVGAQIPPNPPFPDWKNQQGDRRFQRSRSGGDRQGSF